MKTRKGLLISLIACLAFVSIKANSQKLSAADTIKLLCKKWIPISRTINDKQYPIKETSINGNNQLKKGIDTTTFYHFNMDRTIKVRGMFGSLDASWQYNSSKKLVEIFDKYGKVYWKVIRIDNRNLTFDIGEGMEINYQVNE